MTSGVTSGKCLADVGRARAHVGGWDRVLVGGPRHLGGRLAVAGLVEGVAARATDGALGA